MFTGLIEDVGSIRAVSHGDGGLRIEVATSLGSRLTAGDSISVDGVCLTAVDPRADRFSADISPATLDATTLGALAPGSRVNLERALAADGRFGGHLVLGHVDGVAEVTTITPEGSYVWITVDLPPALEAYLVPKGSLAVNGISLTIARLHATHAALQIVPHTMSHTSLGSLRPGDRVNVECDIIGKYVVQAVKART